MSETMTQIFILAFFGLVATMAGFAALLLNERARIRRAARLRRANGTGPSLRMQPDHNSGGSLSYSFARLRRFVVLMGERMAALLGGEAVETSADLASAGYRGRDALLIYAFVKMVLPVVTLVLGLAGVFSTTSFGLEMLLPVGVIIAAALALSKGVDIFVDLRRKKRLALIRRGFPDMLELLVISSEAGLGPQPALHRVAAEMTHSHPELAREVLQMVSEMRMTNDRRGAYEKLSVRVPLPEIGVFTQTLDQSDTYGTPFSRAMRTLITEQRGNRLMMVEEKAARLPVLMTLPLIFCIMPSVFIVLVGPAVISILDNIFQ